MLLQHTSSGNRLSAVINLTFADICHGKMCLYSQIAHGAFSRRIGDQIQIQHLPDQLQSFDTNSGVALSGIQNSHQHHCPDLYPVKWFSHSQRMGPNDVFLKCCSIAG